MSNRSCELCSYFWVSPFEEDEKVGECHRYPPSRSIPSNERVIYYFPNVLKDLSRCGEFLDHREVG